MVKTHCTPALSIELFPISSYFMQSFLLMSHVLGALGNNGAWGKLYGQSWIFQLAPGLEAVGTKLSTGDSVWTPGNVVLLWEWLSTDTGCSGRLWSFPWRDFLPLWFLASLVCLSGLCRCLWRWFGRLSWSGFLALEARGPQSRIEPSNVFRCLQSANANMLPRLDLGKECSNRATCYNKLVHKYSSRKVQSHLQRPLKLTREASNEKER